MSLNFYLNFILKPTVYIPSYCRNPTINWGILEDRTIAFMIRVHLKGAVCFFMVVGEYLSIYISRLCLLLYAYVRPDL